MRTDNIHPLPTTDADDQLGTPPTQKPAWPPWAIQARAQLHNAATNTRDFINADPSGAASLLGAGAMLLLALWLMLAASVNVLTWAVSGHAGHDIVTTVPVVRIATDPIGHWLIVHTAGLPLTASTAAWIWGVAGLVLLYAAAFRHTGAQLLWPLYGIATAAMAWLGTDIAAHRPIAAGLVAAAWIVLSLPALRGRGDRELHVDVRCPHQPRREPTGAALLTGPH